LEWAPTKDKEGNTTDYTWKGFNKDDDGNYVAPEGTVSGGTFNGFTFSSDASTGTGTVEKHSSLGNSNSGVVAQLSSEQSSSVNPFPIYSYFSISGLGFAGSKPSTTEETQVGWFGGWGNGGSLSSITNQMNTVYFGGTLMPPPATGQIDPDYTLESFFIPFTKGMGLLYNGTIRGTSKYMLGMGRLGGSAGKVNYYTKMAWDMGIRGTSPTSVKAGFFVQMNHNAYRLMTGRAWSTLYSKGNAAIQGRIWQNQAIKSGLFGVGTGFGLGYYNLTH
jgi:hypothetical protein